MKKIRQKNKDFDQAFDEGDVSIDFRSGVRTEGLGKVVKFPPLSIPVWLAVEIEGLSKVQANSRASVVRQLLVEAVLQRGKKG